MNASCAKSIQVSQQLLNNAHPKQNSRSANCWAITEVADTATAASEAIDGRNIENCRTTLRTFKVTSPPPPPPPPPLLVLSSVCPHTRLPARSTVRFLVVYMENTKGNENAPNAGQQSKRSEYKYGLASLHRLSNYTLCTLSTRADETRTGFEQTSARLRRRCRGGNLPLTPQRANLFRLYLCNCLRMWPLCT